MPRDGAPSVDGAKNVIAQLEAIGIEVAARTSTTTSTLGSSTSSSATVRAAGRRSIG
jgi:hypothetical protein